MNLSRFWCFMTFLRWFKTKLRWCFSGFACAVTSRIIGDMECPTYQNFRLISRSNLVTFGGDSVSDPIFRVRAWVLLPTTIYRVAARFVD